MADPIIYNATPTGARFHMSPARARWLIGPVGSGKTSAASMELWMKMVSQAPHPMTKRRQTRWIVIRESYPQLLSTTIVTWMEWAGRYGTLSGQSPITWRCEKLLPDGTILDAEVLFYALSDQFDTSKLRSLEVTGGMLSEFAEISEDVVDVLSTRFRYPRTAVLAHDGFDHGPTWTGMFGESNAPSENSHWYRRFEVDRKEGEEVIFYPGAMLAQYNEATNKYDYTPNPDAENISYLPGGFRYYDNMISNMSDEAINNLVLNNYGKDMSGRPVYPTFAKAKHTTRDEYMQPNRGQTMLIGIDPGLNAAAVFGQLNSLGTLAIFDEVVGDNIIFEQFITTMLRPMMASPRYKGMTFEAIVDPASMNKTSMNALTPMAMLHSHGIAARPARSDRLDPRLKSVQTFLRRENGLLISDKATKLVRGFEGGYRYARVKGSASAIYRNEPEKNEFSHPHDGLQYICMEYVAGDNLRQQRDAVRGRRSAGGARLA